MKIRIRQFRPLSGGNTLHGSRPQSGVALVITLILLSVITFMAIAFLVISRGEKSSVTTQTDQLIADQAAQAALDRSVAQLVAQMVITTNEFNYDLMVPTNYSNPLGFNPSGTFVSSPTNVNLDYMVGGGTNWTAQQWEQNVDNLLFDPRAPVFVTNRLRGGLDFRYYLDLNRNGVFDPTGWLTVTNAVGLPTTNVSLFTGDPQWIGGLEFPDRHHGPDNLFTYRYTYFAIPVSKTLDINYIYNNAKSPNALSMTNTDDGFFRNMGASTFEINLASFLVDLNTNVWSPPGIGAGQYTYNWDPSPANPFYFGKLNNGLAFKDAHSILAYRYGNSPRTLAPARQLLGLNGAGAFQNDYFDDYSAGPPMVGANWAVTPDADTAARVNQPWSGSPNTNHFYSISELFDPAKIPPSPGDPSSFPGRLLALGTNIETYNRYTGYRLLSQLGTDSAPEPAGTINLNYDNVTPTNGVASVTNFLAWRPADFLTASALRLLTNAGYVAGLGGVGSHPTNIIVNDRGNLRFQIEVYPTNFYSSSIHRLLQLAANIYDASQPNKPSLFGNLYATNGFPTVFRPIFTNYLNTIYIVGYTNLPDDHAGFFQNLRVPRDPYDPNGPNGILRGRYGPGIFSDMVAGIPLVIGARKGFPNFNELAMQTEVNLTRKLEFRRANERATSPVAFTNQLILMSITNTLGLEAWNSYRTAYPRDLQLMAHLETTAWLSNDFGTQIAASTNNGAAPGFVTHYVTNVLLTLPRQNWAGMFSDRSPQYSFRVPMAPASSHFSFMYPASLQSGLATPIWHVPYRTNDFEKVSDHRLPDMFLRTDTRLYFVLYDSQAHRIVDFVNLLSRPNPVYINLALTSPVQGLMRSNANYTLNSLPGTMWLTNQYGPNGPSFGVLHQIGLSLWTNVTGYVWNSANGTFPAGWDVPGAVNFFRTNLLGWGAPANPPPGSGGLEGPLYLTNRFFAPYAASRTIYVNTSWQANDPLVHYTLGDLTVVQTNSYFVDDTNEPSFTIGNIGAVNGRYEPWGGYVAGAPNPNTKYNFAVKDSQVEPAGPYGHSDDWDFPTNKFPNVGWLGRVHRGTPWQTVYLKSPSVDTTTWLKWSGNPEIVTNFGQFSTNFVPLYTTNQNFVTYYPTMFGMLPDYAFPDGILTFPTNDWALLDIFSTSLNDNSGLGKLNINQTNLAAWSAVLGGVIVTTNGAPGYMAINPAGVYDLSNPNLPVPPLVQLVNGINNTRITVISNQLSGTVSTTVYLTNYNKAFHHLGELMAVPQLSVQSPFLNRTPPPSGVPLISDEDYERIPQQILGLLKCDHTPRFVIYAYGQALKPAEHSYVTSGPFSGLYTNYQVTAETAIRAVVRIDGAPSQPHAVIESYNVLPPD